MSDQTEVYIKNLLKEGIRVARKLPDGSSDMDSFIVSGNEEKFFLPGPEVSLVILAPEGIDSNRVSINLKSDVDLLMLYSRTNSNWSIQIVPNDLAPETPMITYITIGENEPWD